MFTARRNSALSHYFDTKSLIWYKIFKENFTIIIAMNIKHLNSLNLSVHADKSARRNAESVSTFYNHLNIEGDKNGKIKHSYG